jgi:hypothetical protein
MKDCSVCLQNKPLVEFDVHKRSGVLSYCKGCRRQKRKDYYLKNKEKEIKKATEWSQNNKNKKRDYYKAYYYNNRTKENLRSRFKNKIIKQRTPEWADLNKISQFYLEAKKLTELTGIQFHVDHVIPMQGKLVSGLHVHTNLQVIPAYQNLSKSNLYDPVKTDTGV